MMMLLTTRTAKWKTGPDSGHDAGLRQGTRRADAPERASPHRRSQCASRSEPDIPGLEAVVMAHIPHNLVDLFILLHV